MQSIPVDCLVHIASYAGRDAYSLLFVNRDISTSLLSYTYPSIIIFEDKKIARSASFFEHVTRNERYTTISEYLYSFGGIIHVSYKKRSARSSWIRGHYPSSCLPSIHSEWIYLTLPDRHYRLSLNEYDLVRTLLASIPVYRMGSMYTYRRMYLYITDDSSYFHELDVTYSKPSNLQEDEGTRILQLYPVMSMIQYIPNTIIRYNVHTFYARRRRRELGIVLSEEKRIRRVLKNVAFGTLRSHIERLPWRLTI